MDKDKHLPDISVIMAVYNGEHFLRKAIESILEQTFKNFEFIIINDASTDNSEKIIRSYKDKRIRLINNKHNQKLPASLNKGIRQAQGKYIARMDADDIALKNRLAEQYNFMEKNPEIDVCGSSIQCFGAREDIVNWPEHNNKIKVHLLSGVPLAHPTAFFRKRIIFSNNIFYPENNLYAEDYEFWVDLMPFITFYNIPKVLLKYRIHKQQVSKTKKQLQIKNSNIARNKILKYLDLNLSEKEKNILFTIIRGERLTNQEDYLISEIVLDKLFEANQKKNLFNKSLLSDWILQIKTSRTTQYFTRYKYSPRVIKELLAPRMQAKKYLNKKDFFKIIIKSITFFNKKN